MSARQGFRGYCTHNSFGEYRIPVPAQNILYRDYANKHGLHFKLSVNELFFPNCYLHLRGLLEELDYLEGVLMCSIFMLPQDQKLREQIYQRFSESGCELHFVLESIVLRTRLDMEELETIFRIRGQLPHCLGKADLELIEIK